jgi:acyl-CoA thioesterase I
VNSSSLRKRILIVADSITLPRENLPYEDTWVYMIKSAFPDYDIIDRPTSGATSTRLVTEGGGGTILLERYRPQTVILQMGMVECAPRLFKKYGLEHFIMTRVLTTSLQWRYIQYIKKTRRRDPRVTYVSPETFRTNIMNYFQRAQALGTMVIVIPIAPPNSLLLQTSPHAGTNIDLYNKIYREAASPFGNVVIIDPYSGIEIDSLALDEVHLNEKGSRYIAEALIPLL